ncbi:MAG: hypothetical protein CVV53_00095 [Spirochaetae bacterium HGW-Spirochaetae-9]|nr:MAG: hypothetical protein CVV53_00095 [Spirochaetae bacterium HGW-Spirochaetae-9]
MALSIRNPEVEKLTRKLARRSGSTMTEVIADALEAKLSSLDTKVIPRRAAIAEIAAECAALPDIDSRSAEEILGYGANGGFADGDR